MKQILAVYDKEQRYGEKLTGYLSAKQMLPFRIVAFTKEEALLAFAKTEEISVLLIHEKVLSEEISVLPINRILVLTEEQQMSCAENFSKPNMVSVYKYQSMERIVQEILDCYEALLPPQSDQGILRRGKTGVITVYSPVHHCFKTSFALVYGQVLSEKERILFVSLEVHAGFEKLFGLTAGADLSDALYYYRQGSLGVHISDIIQKIGNLDILLPVHYPEDMAGIQLDEFLGLLYALQEECGYTGIVLDAAEALCCPGEILRRSGRILMPLKEDFVSKAKLEEFENCMRSSGGSDVLEQVEKLKLPCEIGLNSQKQYLEQLMWGCLGDYVRGMLSGDWG